VSVPVPGAVEVVLYRARPGVADEQAVEASDALRSDLESVPATSAAVS
jgi:hypothetical protein